MRGCVFFVWVRLFAAGLLNSASRYKAGGVTSHKAYPQQVVNMTPHSAAQTAREGEEADVHVSKHGGPRSAQKCVLSL